LHGRGYGSPGLGFGPPVTPTIVKQLLIAYAVVFAAQLVLGNAFTLLFSVQPVSVWQAGFLWQPFTYMWLHSPTHWGHVLMNAFVLWMFGSQLAMAWGARRFLRFYLFSGVGAGFVIATWPYLAYWLGLSSPFTLGASTLGASGAIYGVMLAYSLTWPDRTIMLIFPPVAFRAIWLIPALFFMSMILDPSGRVSHIGHLGGVLAGWIYLRRRGEAGNALTFSHLQYRWRRWRMRQKLRAVQREDLEARRRSERRDDETRTLH
jgi:membrane associated rhomboid family serine protease